MTDLLNSAAEADLNTQYPIPPIPNTQGRTKDPTSAPLGYWIFVGVDIGYCIASFTMRRAAPSRRFSVGTTARDLDSHYPVPPIPNLRGRAKEPAPRALRALIALSKITHGTE